MPRPLTLSLGFEPLTLARRWDLMPETAERVSTLVLSGELDGWLADSATRRQCIAIWQQLGDVSFVAAYSERELTRLVRDRLLRAFGSGELVGYRRARPTSAVPPAPKEAAATSDPVPVTAEPQKTTLEVLHRYHDDEPIHGAEYEVHFNDGSVRKGKLGNDGRLRLENVPPGRAQIRFGLDAREYQRADDKKNEAYRESWSRADSEALVRKVMGS